MSGDLIKRMPNRTVLPDHVIDKGLIATALTAALAALLLCYQLP
ncbi:hypothetical protein [Microvirga sp. Mcv34]|nr:hypothetical protein [Microvirga sp. Mcv34]